MRPNLEGPVGGPAARILGASPSHHMPPNWITNKSLPSYFWGPAIKELSEPTVCQNSKRQTTTCPLLARVRLQTSFLLVSTRKICILEMSAILILRTKSPQSWFWSPNLEGPVRGPASKSLNAWLLLNWTHYRWVSPNSKTDEETDQDHYLRQTFGDKRLKKSKEY